MAADIYLITIPTFVSSMSLIFVNSKCKMSTDLGTFFIQSYIVNNWRDGGRLMSGNTTFFNICYVSWVYF